MKKSLLFILVCISFFCSNAQVYVDATATTGANNGTSWANAYTNLQPALDHAMPGNEIWVAAGTYNPTQETDGAPTGAGNERYRAFHIANKDVKIYGGFAGTETMLSERDWQANPTILSGDFGGDDVVTGSGATLIITNNTENAYHVFVSVGLSAVFELDGFSIVGGNAEGAGSYPYAGEIISNDLGGGMYNASSSPKLTKVTFLGNNASNSGGGMFNDSSSPTLTNVTFSGNNAANNNGGGMYNFASSSPTLTNVTFLGNNADFEGGGMFNSLSSSPTLTNVTFSGNNADVYGRGMSNVSSSPTLTNTLFYGNTSPDPNQKDIFNTSSTTTLSFSAVEDYNITGCASCITLTTSPFVDGADPDGADDVFMTADDGLRLIFGSAPAGAGTITGAPATDIAGTTRPSPPSMGAYEGVPLPCQAATRLFVDITATGANNGTTWADAFNDFQPALDCADAGEEIWVATGTYLPTQEPDGGTITARNRAFHIANKNVKIYGGFAGTEMAVTERDWQANPTILSGDFGGDDVVTGSGATLSIAMNGENAYHTFVSVGLSSASEIDGFSIVGGNANSLGDYTYEGTTIFNSRGGGLYNGSFSSPTITNVTFSGNNAANNGGGMYNLVSSSPILTNVTFSGNNASSGGGMYNITSSSPTLTNVTFSGNNADVFGGGVFNTFSSSPTLTNVTFSGNNANSGGGGIINVNSSSPTLTNVTFSGNNAANLGGGMFNTNGSSPILTNVTFSGNNAANNNGGGMYNTNSSSPTLINTLFYGNTSPNQKDIFNDASSTPILSHSAFEDYVYGAAAGCIRLMADPFVDAADPDGADDILMTADDGLRLAGGAPAAGTGTSTGAPLTDIAGSTRTIPPSMGAYAAEILPVDHFITTWNTANPGISNNTSITLPTTGGGYNYDVDWENDGIFDDFGVTGNITHDYTVAGTYSVAIRGSFPRIFFTNDGDQQKILSINQWGAIAWSSMANAFAGCSNLDVNATDTPNLSGVTDMSGMFRFATVFNGDIGAWDVSNVENMSFMFDLTAFNQDIGAWNVGNVENMAGMFFRTPFNRNISNWNVSSVTDMNGMFANTTAFNQDIGTWNVSNVENMSFMFAFTTAFNQDVSIWNVGSVMDMSSMFSGAAVFNQDIGTWNVSNVTNMNQMFFGATSFNQDIGNWDIGKVTAMSSMFNNVTLSTANYDATLIGWATDSSGTAGDMIDDIPSNIVFSGGNSFYCASQAKRQELIDNFTWTITDGGFSNPPVAICKNITVQLDATGVVTIVGGDVDDGSTDGCTGSATLSVSPSTFDCTNLGANTVTLTITDSNGNMATCTSIVTVEDTNAPTASCVAPFTVQLDATGNATIAATDIDNGSTAICGVASTTIDVTSFDCSNIGANTVTLTVMANNGMTATCTTIVTVEDTNAPTASCVAPFTVQLDATGNATIAATDIDNGSTAICGVASTTIDVTSFDCTNIGANTVTLTVTANNGMTATCTTIVTVEDNVAPIANCAAPFTIQLDASGMASITVADIENGSTDACGIASTSIDVTDFTCADVGANTVTLTVTDVNGNTSTCTTIVTVEDNVAPIANCAAPFTIQLDASGMASITAADIENGSTDACGIASTSIDVTDFTCADVGANTVTLTVTDVNGNTSTCTTIVTVEDNVAPIANCAAPFTIQLDANGMANITVADVDNGSTDACGIESTSIDVTDFTCADVGANTVTLTVTDVNGNTSTCTTIVTVEDNVAPIIGCPADLNVNTGLGECFAIVTYTTPIAFDVCGVASVALTSGLPSGSQFPVGPNVVEYTAMDVNGNTSVCNFTITIIDNELPMAVCQDITIQLDANGDAMIVVADVDGGSTDNCGVASTSIDIDTFDCSNVGPNNVTLTVTDVNGNVSNCVAVVTVEDVTAPVVVCMDITVQLDATGTVTILGSDVDGGSTDTCGIASYDLDIDTFDCSNVGANTVTLTVTDVNGNESTCTAVVTVEDVTAPEIVCMDFTLELGAGGTAMLNPSDVISSTSDSCGILSSAVSVVDFDCSDIGTPVTVVVFVVDNNGNSSTCNAVVTVVDLLAPLVTCPADITVDPGPGNLFYEVPDYFALGEATAEDNCTDPVTILSQDPAPGTLLSDGVYSVTMTAEDEYGNVGTCDFLLTIESVLGIDDVEVSLETIFMYPNPAKDYVMLSNPQALDLDSAAIFDIKGRLIQTIDLTNMGIEKVIDVSNLNAAVYTVEIRSGQGIISKQLLKE